MEVDETNGQQLQESAEAGNEATEQVAEEIQKVKFGEVEVPLTEAQKAWESYRNDTSWRAKNTQEAQRIARDREQLQKAAALEKYLSENPDKYEKVKAIFAEQAKPGVPPEMSELQERLRQIEVENAEVKLQTTMADLERKHKDMFDSDPELKEKIIRFALDNGRKDLDNVFKIVTYDSLMERGIKQGLEKAQAARKKSTELGNAAPGGSPMAKNIREKLKGKSFDSPEMIEALLSHPAMQELGD